MISWERIQNFLRRLAADGTKSVPATLAESRHLRRRTRTRRSTRVQVASTAIEALEPRRLLTGTWTALTNPAPSGSGTMLLLSDGTVMVQGGGITNQWAKLTPDSTGSYVNGTWSPLASMNTARRFYGSDVLPDGRVLVVGGEDSGPAAVRNFSNTGEIYNPVTNKWSAIPNFPELIGGDIPTETLPNGQVIAGNPEGPETEIFNPATDRWTPGADKADDDESDEETWVKLPDGSILSYNISEDAQDTQRYIPSLNEWVDSGTVPLEPTTNTELGPALLLPDGRVFLIGATGQTALYTPSKTLTGPGSWALGPDVPDGLGANDAAAAELVNGQVLFTAGGAPAYTPPTEVFDFDPVANTITQVTTPAAMGLQNLAPSVTRMLALPSGQVMFNFGTDNAYVYTPSGPPSNSWRPAISSIVSDGGGTFTLTGTQLNGISEGASYGDDAQMASNYPIIQLTDANGVVRYARSFNWSSTGVATGSTPLSVQFTLPAGASSVNRVSVIANGIASPSVLLVGGLSRSSNDTITLGVTQSQGSPVVSVNVDGASTTWGNVSSVIAADGDGNDIYNVNSTLAGIPISINGGAGNDTFNVTPGGMKVSTVQGELTVTGGGGTNTLDIDDSANTTGSTWTITGTSILQNAAAAIAYGGLQNLSILGGSGTTTYNIDSTIAATPVSIQGGAGNDAFNISPDSSFVDNLQGALTIDGCAGSNVL